MSIEWFFYLGFKLFTKEFCSKSPPLFIQCWPFQRSPTQHLKQSIVHPIASGIFVRALFTLLLLELSWSYIEACNIKEKILQHVAMVVLRYFIGKHSFILIERASASIHFKQLSWMVELCWSSNDCMILSVWGWEAKKQTRPAWYGLYSVAFQTHFFIIFLNNPAHKCNLCKLATYMCFE